MRTVDVLIAARDLLSKKENWMTGSLGYTDGDGKSCFCALGATLKSGGCIVPPKSNGRRHGEWEAAAPTFEVSGTRGISGGTEVVERSPLRVLQFFESQGIYLRSTAKAINYLTAAVAAESNGAVNEVFYANDHKKFGYDFIMRAFDRAIRNAKRRHINGDRSKATAQALV